MNLHSPKVNAFGLSERVAIGSENFFFEVILQLRKTSTCFRFHSISDTLLKKLIEVLRWPVLDLRVLRLLVFKAFKLKPVIPIANAWELQTTLESVSAEEHRLQQRHNF